MIRLSSFHAEAVLAGCLVVAAAWPCAALTLQEALSKDTHFQNLIAQRESRKNAIMLEYGCHGIACHRWPAEVSCSACLPGNAQYDECKASCVPEGGKWPIANMLNYDPQYLSLNAQLQARRNAVKTQFNCDDTNCKPSECRKPQMTDTGMTAVCNGTLVSCTFVVKNGKLVCE